MQPQIYTADEHHIRDNLIDAEALQVLSRLHEAGFVAYLVGGGVRDLLMHLKPKDFDISTSARPEQIKHLFRRQCLLIGRRFRLAHIRFGRKIIETSTFRAGNVEAEELILRDNQWGTPEEDVLRRDFTINGLYYDPLDHRIIDYVGGFEDLKNRLLKSIGDPALRYVQDPVRMLRCLKFLARFDLQPEEQTLQAIASCRQEILKSAPARILEEMLRMLESGASLPFIDLLQAHGLLPLLFPYISEVLAAKTGEKIRRYLEVADRFIKEERPGRVSRSALACCLLYPMLEEVVEAEFLSHDKRPHLGQIHELVRELIWMAIVDVFPPFPKRMRAHIAFVLETQYRLTPLTSRKVRKGRLASHKDFPRALQLLKFRTLVDPTLEPAYREWATR